MKALALIIATSIISLSALVLAFQPVPSLHRRSLSPRFTTSTSATTTKDEEPTTTFISPSMQVYIEDTDAYGVMYNANYLRAYERAIHKMSITEGALADPRWFVLGATEHRFKGSPPLGGEFVIKGELVERDCQDNSCIETWTCEMTAPGDNKPKVYNTAVVTIASSTVPQNHMASPPFDNAEGSTVRSTYEPYRDEFDPELSYRMPIRNVLNLFERARSDYLGGPDELQRMAAEDGILWVVTGVDDCELCNLGDAGWEEEDDEGAVQCTPGEQVTVKTNFIAKRGGMTIECKQTLLVSAFDEDLGECRNRRLAQGMITIMALDAKSRRPTRKIPARFLEKMSGDGGLETTTKRDKKTKKQEKKDTTKETVVDNAN